MPKSITVEYKKFTNSSDTFIISARPGTDRAATIAITTEQAWSLALHLLTKLRKLG